jgi:hypothetical protein
VIVHSAGIQDRVAARAVLMRLFCRFDTITKVYADGGYTVSVRSSPSGRLGVSNREVSTCFLSGHLLSGSKQPGKSRPGVRRRCSRAGVARCG